MSERSLQKIMASNSSTCVISVCSLTHEHVWRLTSQLLPRFVEADDFVVFVPSHEIERFKEITNPQIRVISEDQLGKNYSEKLLAAVNSSPFTNRYGWYLQQFLKIEALIQIQADSLVIWDADCVPLRPITLFDQRKRPIYMEAGEHHLDYFFMIERLLGLVKVHRPSFVIPGFPIHKIWLQEMIAEIESRHYPKTWFEALIACTDFDQPSGFSEYETLGTWVSNSYPDQWTTSQIAWERLGQSRFGYAKDFEVEELIKIGTQENLDIVSFENWDFRGWQKLLNISKNLPKFIRDRKREA
jgi:hypothetical protein